MLIAWPGNAQRPDWLSLSLSSNNSAMSFSRLARLVSGPYHPGAELGAGWSIKSNKRGQLYVEARLGYLYHRFVQHGISLYGSSGYRYDIGNGFGIGAGIGLGYFHALPATAVATLNDKGEYKQSGKWGRPQALVMLELAMSRQFRIKHRTVAAFLRYQQRLQTPFNKAYVPVLPYNSLQAGIAFPIPARIKAPEATSHEE